MKYKLIKTTYGDYNYLSFNGKWIDKNGNVWDCGSAKEIEFNKENIKNFDKEIFLVNYSILFYPNISNVNSLMLDNLCINKNFISYFIEHDNYIIINVNNREFTIFTEEVKYIVSILNETNTL
jgi:hypothetical protein